MRQVTHENLYVLWQRGGCEGLHLLESLALDSGFCTCQIHAVCLSGVLKCECLGSSQAPMWHNRTVCSKKRQDLCTSRDVGQLKPVQSCVQSSCSCSLQHWHVSVHTCIATLKHTVPQPHAGRKRSNVTGMQRRVRLTRFATVLPRLSKKGENKRIYKKVDVADVVKATCEPKACQQGCLNNTNLGFQQRFTFQSSVCAESWPGGSWCAGCCSACHAGGCHQCGTGPQHMSRQPGS